MALLMLPSTRMDHSLLLGLWWGLLLLLKLLVSDLLLDTFKLLKVVFTVFACLNRLQIREEVTCLLMWSLHSYFCVVL